MKCGLNLTAASFRKQFLLFGVNLRKSKHYTRFPCNSELYFRESISLKNLHKPLSLRYNLASIEYHPTLKYPDLWNSVSTYDKLHQDPAFQRGNRLGGKLGHSLTLQPGLKYRVDRDINILPRGELRISGNTQLEFENGLGILIQVCEMIHHVTIIFMCKIHDFLVRIYLF
jgi:hypothetical protein